MTTHYRIVLCTCPDDGSAADLARRLVENRLAACVNVLPGLTSVYGWQGQIETDREALLVVKTRADRFDDLAACIRRHHPYELPEIVAVPIEQGSSTYLQWIDSWLDASSS